MLLGVSFCTMSNDFGNCKLFEITRADLARVFDTSNFARASRNPQT